ncbi:hypothetical protein [Actinoplanes couchii]|uniref:Uncharacterized protein n=1 Tax=Actinoplanes couchii TaxID=403638 RepID=A0ABQ3XLX5_9ACTN|nr:hypothetical protein [Actinoplanes couchii]MDR6319389.1 hypothetical protein [Actinoplanes couchii]GID59400.1 hypothetical protein Aco03nite_078040 [Actinoplanes couchii]
MADIQFPNTLFGPGAFVAEVLDNNSTPAEVLEASLPFQVKTSWRVDPLTALHFGGDWQVSVYVEAIGPGPEQLIGTVTVPLDGGQTYTAIVEVPANTLPDAPAPPASGVYKLVTVLTHRNFNRISNVSAVAEGPLVRIG